MLSLVTTLDEARAQGLSDQEVRLLIRLLNDLYPRLTQVPVWAAMSALVTLLHAFAVETMEPEHRSDLARDVADLLLSDAHGRLPCA